MTAQVLYDRVRTGQPTILLDVRDTSEYMKFNIGGNRMTVAEIEQNAEKLKKYTKTHTVVVGCVYFDSKRIPAAVRRLIAIGFDDVYALDGSRYTGGGLLAFSNAFPRIRVPQVNLSLSFSY